MTVDDVLAEVVRDRAYYECSGGGLTLSGGEPLSQPLFALALLERAKHLNLHTCLDTCGAVHPGRLQDALPFVDLFLYDYKATPAGVHARLTGVSNRLIVENLDYLYERGARIILRCPLVPGLNDTTEHLEAIARLSERYPDLLGIEIMAFHDMGKAKAGRVGMVNPLGDLASADEVQKSRWLASLVEMGCERAVSS
jgi:pyruvate formate lyase activating enzyme